MYLDIVLIVITIFLLMINVMMETAVTTFTRAKLFYFYKNHRNYHYVKDFKDKIGEIVFFVLVFDNIFQYVYSILIANFCLKYHFSPAFIGGILFIISISAEIIVKKIVIKNPEKSILAIGYYTYIVNKILEHFNNIFNKLLKKPHQSVSTKYFPDDNLLFEINMKSTEDEMTGGIMKNVLKIKSVYIEDIMTVKDKIISLELKDTPEEIIEDIKNKNFISHIPDYIPVWKDNPNNFTKLLNVKMFLNNYIKGKNSIELSLEEMFFVSCETSIYTLLHTFKKYFKEFAFVVNEEGDLMGIVTTQDLLEEIVGDEFFEQKNVITEEFSDQNEKFFTVSGDLSLTDLSKNFNLHLSGENCYTVSDFIISTTKRIPEKGEVLNYDNFSIIIATRNPKKIVRVLIAVDK